MEWDDIQLHLGSKRRNQWWVRGNINGGKAEQKGVEITGSWAGDRPSELRRERVPRDPEFTEKTVFPDAGRRQPIDEGTVMPDLAGGKVLGLGRVHVPRLPECRVTSGPGSRTATRARSGTASTRSPTIRTPRRRRNASSALDQKLPSWTTTTLQLGFTRETGWETSLIVRNVFDEQSYDYLSSVRLRRRSSATRASGTSGTCNGRCTLGLSFTKKW